MAGRQSRSVEVQISNKTRNFTLKNPRMEGGQSRTVKIQISNNTKNFTLEKPRTYFMSGVSLIPPSPVLPPGSSGSSHFSSYPDSLPLRGLVTYEAESFTLAILFLIPVDLEKKPVKLGLELSLDKDHLDDLDDTFYRILGGTSPPGPDGTSGDIRDIRRQCQEPALVTAGPVKVMATMSRCPKAVIKVVLADWRDGGKETPGMGKDGQGK